MLKRFASLRASPVARMLALSALALLAGAGGARIAPSPPSQVSTLVVIDVASQRLVAYRDGLPIASSPVSTGKPGYATPLGVFTILEKDMFHRSNQYSDAPMPHMQRLTWGGVALHGGALPGYPASHGCIRLPYDFARQLFGETRLGATVMVINQHGWRGGKTSSRDVPAFWRPGLATRGPLSIVVSGADRRMMVLRDGVAIGSAPVAFDGVIERPQAYVLRESGWERVALPGEAVLPRGGARAAPEPGA